jgi:molybdopterin synthase catalytic subunit
MGIRLTQEPIDVEALRREGDYPECGGICTFEGVVRDHHNGRKVSSLVYEAYEPMAERELERLIAELQTEWPSCHVRVLHRLGHLQIGDAAVAIVVFAPHRLEAFRACEAMIDRIKKCVPIWKMEFYADGGEDWVICEHSHGSAG